MDPNEFTRNVSNHTLEELAPYQEQYVAWSLDGKRILAHAAELAELYKEVDRKRITEYVVDYVPDPEVRYLGGGFDFCDGTAEEVAVNEPEAPANE